MTLVGDIRAPTTRIAAAGLTGGAAMTSGAIPICVDAGDAVRRIYGPRQSERRPHPPISPAVSGR